MNVLIASDVFFDFFSDKPELSDNALHILALIESSKYNIQGYVTKTTLDKVFNIIEERNGKGKQAVEWIEKIPNIKVCSWEKSRFQIFVANFLEFDLELVCNVACCLFSQPKIDGIVTSDAKEYNKFLQNFNFDSSIVFNKVEIFDSIEFFVFFMNSSDSSIDPNSYLEIDPGQLISFWPWLIEGLAARKILPQSSLLLISLSLIIYVLEELRKNKFLFLTISGTLVWIGIFPGAEVGVLSKVVDGALISGSFTEIAVMSSLSPGTSQNQKNEEWIEAEIIDPKRTEKVTTRWAWSGYLVGALAVGMGIFATTSVAKKLAILVGLTSPLFEPLFISLKLVSVLIIACSCCVSFYYFGRLNWTWLLRMVTVVGSLWLGGEFLVLAGTGSSVGALVVAEVGALTIAGVSAFFGNLQWKSFFILILVGFLTLAGATGGIGSVFLTIFGGIALTLMGTRAFVLLKK